MVVFWECVILLDFFFYNDFTVINAYKISTVIQMVLFYVYEKETSLFSPRVTLKIIPRTQIWLFYGKEVPKPNEHWNQTKGDVKEQILSKKCPFV